MGLGDIFSAYYRGSGAELEGLKTQHETQKYRDEMGLREALQGAMSQQQGMTQQNQALEQDFSRMGGGGGDMAQLQELLRKPTAQQPAMSPERLALDYWRQRDPKKAMEIHNDIMKQAQTQMALGGDPEQAFNYYNQATGNNLKYAGTKGEYHYFGDAQGGYYRIQNRPGAEPESIAEGTPKPDPMEMLLAREDLAGKRQEKQFQQQSEMQGRQFEQQSKMTLEQQSAAERRLAQQLAAADRRTAMTIAAGNERANKKNAGKPMPAPALKMQQEELDALGTAEGIKSDLGAVLNQVNGGKLDLGPVSNLISKGRNAVGMSSESSRNFASFRSTLEKLRNDSLRLNKGVQTEGDAQRAWNELFEGINDPELVKQRIGEIQRINDRGATLRQMNVENIRNNYGQDPLDTSGYKTPAPVLGPKSQGKPQQSKPQRPLSGPAQAVLNKYRRP